MKPDFHWMVVRRLCWVAIYPIVIGMAGCSQTSGLQDRIDAQIRYDREHPRSRHNKTQQTLADEIATALKSTTPASLRSPVIASTVLAKENDDAFTLIMFWVED